MTFASGVRSALVPAVVFWMSVASEKKTMAEPLSASFRVMLMSSFWIIVPVIAAAPFSLLPCIFGISPLLAKFALIFPWGFWELKELVAEFATDFA